MGLGIGFYHLKPRYLLFWSPTAAQKSTYSYNNGIALSMHP